MKNWLLAFRPKTLTAALVPIFVGSALSYSETGTVSWLVILLTLLASFFIQIATNLFNDAIDFKKGADKETRTGPMRVTQAGIFSSKQVLLVAVGFCGLAMACGIPLVMRGGSSIMAIGIVSLVLAYCYTGGPWPLAYKGMGDLFVIVFFGLIAVSGVYYLHTLTWTLSSMVAGLQVGFLATVLIAINNLRDVNEDKLVNKNTLAVRFGEKFAQFEIGTLLFVSFALGIYWILQDEWLAALLPLVLVPTSVKLFTSIRSTSPGPTYNAFLAKAALIHLVFGIQISLGFLII